MLAHGCQDPTQVTLDIRTNVVCSDMKGVSIVVAKDPRSAETRAAFFGDGPRFASAETTNCDESTSPHSVGTLVVTPSGDQGAVVVVAAFGGLTTDQCTKTSFPAGCIIARRRFSFVDRTRITLPILLDPSCSGIPCNETSTCVGRRCVDSEVTCAGGTCAEPSGATVDGGIVGEDGGSLPLPDGSLLNISEAGLVDVRGDGASIGSGTCPAVICTGGAQICLPTETCCYAGSVATCIDATSCGTMAGCCRSASDCLNGTICCASTSLPSSTTRLSCRTLAECKSLSGVSVCTTDSTGCGAASAGCTGEVYSQAPEFFRCS